MQSTACAAAGGWTAPRSARTAKSAALAACSAALLVFSIVLAALLTDAGVLAEVSVGYAVPAVLCVFSLLLPAADLVQAHLFRSGRKGQKAPSENADGQN